MQSIVPGQVGDGDGLAVASEHVAVLSVFALLAALVFAVLALVVFADFLFRSVFGVLH